MLFNSIDFLIFFAIVFTLYWALPGKWRPLLLLVSGCYFYMAFVPKYILILFYLIVLDYTLGLLIGRAQGKARHLYLTLSIVANVGTLFVFKYFNFFNENLSALASFLHWNYSLEALSLLLPLGLSFHIFQSMSYVIEVYRGNYPPEKNLLTYAIYVLYFPQLVAGPIERPAQLLPQLHTTHEFSVDRTISGLQLMLWGFFKKVVVGNNLALVVDHIYAHYGTLDASILVLGAIAFSFQLYADFSGYSDIAIGSSRVLGIELVQNFRRPYFSRSTAELWRRWHLSLSSWFRDYLYIPLGGNRVGLLKQCRNTLIVFAIMGLWHGASWNFVIMGMLFGSYIVAGLLTKTLRERIAQRIGLRGKIRALWQILLTFTLVTFAWVFFRAESAAQALGYAGRLFTGWGDNIFRFFFCSDYCTPSIIGVDRNSFITIVISVTILVVVDLIQERGIELPKWAQRRLFIWPAYQLLILWILFAGHFAPKTFIYFQF